MVILGVKTKRGAEVHINVGRGCGSVSTNAWCINNTCYGWQTVTDTDAVNELIDIVRATPSRKPDMLVDFLKKYPDPTTVASRKYTGTFVPVKAGSRSGKTATPVTPVDLVTESPATVDSVVESPKTVTVDIDTAIPIAETKEPERVDPQLQMAKRQWGAEFIKFFSEFNEEPSTRMINTLGKQTTVNNCIKYISDFYDLEDHPDKDAIKDKAKSTEFRGLCAQAMALHSEKKLNKRLEIYFGAKGTGKTYTARHKYPDASVTICNESIQPDDLLDYIKVDGDSTATHQTTLRYDMEHGRVHIMDEINLLPFKTLRYLQGITDDKPVFNHNGEDIVIKEGFKIIGTMNLWVNGQCAFLPEPLVDRAEVIKEFKMTPELAGDAL